MFSYKSLLIISVVLVFLFGCIVQNAQNKTSPPQISPNPAPNIPPNNQVNNTPPVANETTPTYPSVIPTNDSHQLCGDDKREGTEECDGSDVSACAQGKVCDNVCRCVTPLQDYHTACINGTCQIVKGPGTKECSTDPDCGGGK